MDISGRAALPRFGSIASRIVHLLIVAAISFTIGAASPHLPLSLATWSVSPRDSAPMALPLLIGCLGLLSWATIRQYRRQFDVLAPGMMAAELLAIWSLALLGLRWKQVALVWPVDFGAAVSATSVSAKACLLCACGMAATVIGGLTWREACRPRPGRCRGCGYSLVGLKQSRCPECGRTVADEERVGN